MSKYVFDPVTLPSGVLSMSFTNNDGNAQTVHASGNYLVTMASLRETIEENGIGGVPRLSDMEFELFDRDGLFHDAILNRSVITRCYATISLSVDGIEYSLFYGVIDLSTVEYPSIYDDGTGREEHTVKFVIVSMLSRLQQTAMTDFRDELNTTQWLQQDTVSPANYFVYLRDVLALAYSYIDKSKIVYVAFDFPFSLSYTNPITNVEVIKDPRDVLMFFKYILINDIFFPFFDENNSKSFIQLGDVYSFVQKICGSLLVYSLIEYDNADDSFRVTLKHRKSGTVVNPPGMLLESVEKNYYEYEALRVSTNSGVYSDRRIYPNQTRAYETGISDAQFDIVQQKFDFINVFGLNPNVVGSKGNADNQCFFMDNDFTHYFTDIQSNILHTGSWNHWLIYNFARYWAAQKGSDRTNRNEVIGSKVFERRYSGVGIGANSVKLLDKLTIGGTDYPIFDIERDFVRNEIKVRCVEY